MVKIVLTLVMDSSNSGSISNGCNNSLNVMASTSSNTESGMASYTTQLGPKTSLLQHIKEEAYLLSPNQRVFTTSTEFSPFTIAPKVHHQRVEISQEIIDVSVFQTMVLAILMVRSNASEQRDDGSSSRNVVNQMPASIGNVKQGHGSSSCSSQSDVNMTDPRLISQNPNQLSFVHVLTSIDASDERTIEPSSTLAEPNRATVANNVQNNNSEHDRMRMDIDNLSFEHGKYRVNKYVGTPKKTKNLLRLSDEFVNRQEPGKLDCRHNYHLACIKKWLMEKNCCPLCKRTAILK
ncbi:hypothetical protein M9H77_26036 [Catharanthus roseus]|uniref:Uncharacterized protein n=1 Tax=Catharanthus roseus TaxID=4058 RepID=A0ACC0AB67_CATRO|nr:hypothetical protein M9H77_26036 [Catharanthus roseus]